MPALPVLTGRKTVRAFEKAGWQVARQRGSHIILIKEGENVTLSVPDHKEVAKDRQRHASQFDSLCRDDDGRIYAPAVTGLRQSV
jgi:predicted RNA binding protein YcfA (HicA-like mRNA interferase family)